MIKFDDVTKENINERNPNRPQITDPILLIQSILIIRSPESRKANPVFNLISRQPEIDRTYLYAKGPNEAKNQLLVKKQEIQDKNM